MDTFWMCVVLGFAGIGVVSCIGPCFEWCLNRKEKKRGIQIRTELLVEKVERLDLDRKTLALDVKQEVRLLEGKLEHQLDKLYKVVELLEKKAVLKESRYLKKPLSYGPKMYYGVPYDLVSEEQAVTQMQEQREKAVRDGFTLIHTHQDGSETWVKKDKGWASKKD